MSIPPKSGKDGRAIVRKPGNLAAVPAPDAPDVAPAFGVATESSVGSGAPQMPGAGAASGALTLRVVEAVTKDVDRGVVRLHPRDMAIMCLTPGSFVEVAGEQRATVGRLLSSASGAADSPPGVIHMDGVMRANAGTALDQHVTVRPAAVREADVLVLSALDAADLTLSESQVAHLLRLLNGMGAVTGDHLRVNLLGTKLQTFLVVRTEPLGPVVVSANTVIVQGERGATEEELTLSYEDIGGLEREIQRVRELVELPMRYPEVFERLGIDAPRGVLLHGPPGTGKTLIARAVASEARAHFIHVNGPEIIDKWYGSSEARLREIFAEAAKHAPAIIFMDEIDAIAPKREEMSGDRQVERRVVAQLLATLDGLQSRGQVIVLAATNIPDTLDPALRRPGRFDREIAIGAPDESGRREIIEIHSRGMPLAGDVDLDRLAADTHGFVGADLAAVCREAAMSAMRRVLREVDLSLPQIPFEKLVALRVTQSDFEAALAEVEPSAIREVITQRPQVGWEDVGGLSDLRRVLDEAVIWPLVNPGLFERIGISPCKGVLLYGPPGTGKTLVAKAVAREADANFVSIKGPQLLSRWVGESEKGVREIFKKARQVAPCLVFFDELESLAPVRGRGDSQVLERVVSQLLAEMDGLEELRGVVVLAATNRLDLVDPALLRPGRFDVLVELKPPDTGGRREILEVITRRMPLAADVDLRELAEHTEGLTGADIEGICRRAGMLALRESTQEDGLPAEGLRIGRRHFELSLVELTASRPV